VSKIYYRIIISSYLHFDWRAFEYFEDAIYGIIKLFLRGLIVKKVNFYRRNDVHSEHTRTICFGPRDYVFHFRRRLGRNSRNITRIRPS